MKTLLGSSLLPFKGSDKAKMRPGSPAGKVVFDLKIRVHLCPSVV
jgi:hypothetical protein